MGSVRACHNYARISPTKVRPFADLIRGMSADEGLNQLRYLPNRGARMLEVVLKSVMANAADKGVRNVGRLRIAEARVDGGPMYKRVRPRARGMAFLVKCRSAHIHVALDVPELG